MFFRKPHAVIWPQSNTVNFYLDRSANNIFSLDINLWQPLSDTDCQSLTSLLSQEKVSGYSVLLPDDVVYTKSFIYDSEITKIDKNEVIGLARSFINFKINPDSINYTLIPSPGKTIIQSRIFDSSKLAVLEENLRRLGLASPHYETVSQSLVNLFAASSPDPFYLLYPQGNGEHLLVLATGASVYLTNILKGKQLEIQKILNYSKLYFPSLVSKIFLPSDLEVELVATTPLNKQSYNQSNIALSFNKTTNLPLPVIGQLVSPDTKAAIINSSDTNLSPTPKMENKKSILPFIAVFVITAALASVIIWFVLNRNSSDTPEAPIVTDITPTETLPATPTPTVMPTLAEISKKIKIQVLNATDINGQAATLKERLTKLGFTSVAVGNSKEKLTENKLEVKDAATGNYFSQKLSGFFDVAPSASTATSTYDAVFYIGTKLDDSQLTEVLTTASPSATVTKTATATPSVKKTTTPTVTE